MTSTVIITFLICIVLYVQHNQSLLYHFFILHHYYIMYFQITSTASTIILWHICDQSKKTFHYGIVTMRKLIVAIIPIDIHSCISLSLCPFLCLFVGALSTSICYESGIISFWQGCWRNWFNLDNITNIMYVIYWDKRKNFRDIVYQMSPLFCCT